MVSFNAPFVLDRDYIEFLKENISSLHSIYFSLASPLLADARIRFDGQNTRGLQSQLSFFAPVKKYLLANGRFHATSAYSGNISNIVKHIDNLIDLNLIDGLVFADSYLLTALADTSPDTAKQLEAIPSINFSIDHIDKLQVLLDLITRLGFRHPSKIPLDRRLNRQLDELADLVFRLRQRFPGILVELLANEGCMDNCPFRATHEAHIAAVNSTDTLQPFDTYRLNEDLACIRYFNDRPWRILSSPFIRPEDVHHYHDIADIIKISGRTLGAPFLKTTCTAYLQGIHKGNLLELLDTAYWMSKHYHIDNLNIPSDYHRTVSSCLKTCENCSYCQSIFNRHAKITQDRLPDLR